MDGEWYTGIRVAFLNAPKRDETRITAMEVPTVFKKPGLAGRCLDYSEGRLRLDQLTKGLVHQVVPTISWRRSREGREVEGKFEKPLMTTFGGWKKLT